MIQTIIGVHGILQPTIFYLEVKFFADIIKIQVPDQ